MIIYNVTVKTNHSIAAEWLDWLKQEHIPDMLATNCFTHANVLRLLDTDESDGVTYAVQYFAEDKAAYDQYMEKYAITMREKGTGKWGNNFVAFRSLLEVVH
jgi:hypothetical protein